MTAAPRVVLVTPNFENNSLGRTWCLWQLARELGWDPVVVGVKGASVWGPLASSRFAADCRVPQPADRAAARDVVRREVAAADLVVAVKTLPTSLGVALETAAGVPMIVDIDDPDIEVRTSWRPLADRLRRPGFTPYRRSLHRLGAVARTLPRTVSNPVLQRMYGGEIVPHVREPGPAPSWSDRTAPIVRFVGSDRGHKGVGVLRRAVAGLAQEGALLEVTAAAPADAAAHERWLGTTSLDDGLALVRDADVIAVPSLPTLWTPAQLPAKLIDAMMAGRAVVASSTEPVDWALGGTGITVPACDAEALRAALHGLRDPRRRQELGEAARERALATFTVEAVAPVFEQVAAAARGAVRA